MNSIKEKTQSQNLAIAELKKPLEDTRLMWLLIALGVVVVGLPVCNQMASKNM